MKPKNVLLRMSLSIIILIAVVVTAFTVFQHKNNISSTSDQKLQVVAAENFWGNIISQLGGDHVQVTSIISNPNTDPHLYESDAHDASAIARASLVIQNGLGYDDFVGKLLSTSSSTSRQVLSVNNILDVTGNSPNPHLWYDVPRVATIADAFEQALATKDPQNASAYASNLISFKKSLQPILDVIQQIKMKYANAPVAYTERVPEYLLTAAGLNIKTPSGFASAVEDGNDPSPADAAAMDALMTTHSIRVLLYNAQATSSVTEHARDLARQAGIPIIAVTETLPANESTYQSWQLDQAKALLAGLGN